MSPAVDFSGEQLAFQQRTLHAVRSGQGIKHARSPNGWVAADAQGRVVDKWTLNMRSLVCNDDEHPWISANDDKRSTPTFMKQQGRRGYARHMVSHHGVPIVATEGVTIETSPLADSKAPR
jgi:hypothetical protein